jgi:predicted  nucleic acid-binding Zn-ribbon protein
VKDLLRLLIELQRKDSLILEKRRFIDKVPMRIFEVDEPLKQAKLELENMKKKSEAVSKKRREKEAALSEAQEKIRKMKARVSDLKTNKEYQSYQKEIEASEKEIFAIEDEILQLMEEVDVVSKEQKEKEAGVNAEIEKINAFRKNLDAEAAKHEKELDMLKEERVGIVAGIDPEVYKTYMTLLRDSGDGVAVTAARNELCSGCDMNIPPQLYVEIRKNEEILQCPQCRRILYSSDEQ